MKTLQSIIPELNNSQLQLIWREMAAALPRPERDYSADNTDEVSKAVLVAASSAYNEALTEVTAVLKQFIGGQNDVL